MLKPLLIKLAVSLTVRAPPAPWNEGMDME